MASHQFGDIVRLGAASDSDSDISVGDNVPVPDAPPQQQEEMADLDLSWVDASLLAAESESTALGAFQATTPKKEDLDAAVAANANSEIAARAAWALSYKSEQSSLACLDRVRGHQAALNKQAVHLVDVATRQTNWNAEALRNHRDAVFKLFVAVRKRMTAGTPAEKVLLHDKFEKASNMLDEANALMKLCDEESAFYESVTASIRHRNSTHVAGYLRRLSKLKLEARQLRTFFGDLADSEQQ